MLFSREFSKYFLKKKSGSEPEGSVVPVSYTHLQYGLDAYIETRLSDGLEALKPGEGDTLVIAGMGGPLMERILTDGAEAVSYTHLIV